jgi:hypothetical protein
MQVIHNPSISHNFTILLPGTVMRWFILFPLIVYANHGSFVLMNKYLWTNICKPASISRLQASNKTAENTSNLPFTYHIQRMESNMWLLYEIIISKAWRACMLLSMPMCVWALGVHQEPEVNVFSAFFFSPDWNTNLTATYVFSLLTFLITRCKN